jgi:hypothetical protein
MNTGTSSLREALKYVGLGILLTLGVVTASFFIWFMGRAPEPEKRPAAQVVLIRVICVKPRQFLRPLGPQASDPEVFAEFVRDYGCGDSAAVPTPAAWTGRLPAR